MQTIIDGVNVFNPLEGKMQTIIDSFVEFYGEEYREKITNNFNDTEFFFVPRVSAKSLGLGFTEKFKQYFKDRKNHLAKDVLLKACGQEGKDIEFSSDIFVLEFIDEYKDFKDNGEELSSLAFCVINDILTVVLGKGEILSHEEIMKVLNGESKDLQLAQVLDEFLTIVESEEYKDKINALDKEEKRVCSQFESCAVAEKEINGKYDQIRKELLTKFIEKHTNKSIEELSEFTDFDTLLSFLQMTVQDFDDPTKLSDWDKDNFIEMFNTLGIEIEGDFDSYLKNPIVSSMVNDLDIKEEIKKVEKDCLIEALNVNPYMQEVVERINDLNLTDGISCISDIYKYMLNDMGNTGAYCIGKLQDGCKIKQICVAPWSISCRDSTLIHEMNHLADKTYNEEDVKRWCEKYGKESKKLQSWDQLLEEVEYEEESDVAWADGELFYEVINDDLALLILKILHNKGIKINLMVNDNEKSIASYAMANMMIGKFISDNLEKIKTGTMCDDEEITSKIFDNKFISDIGKCVDSFLTACFENDEAYYRLSDMLKEKQCSLSDIVKLDLSWTEEQLRFIEPARRFEQIIENYMSKEIA